MYCRKGLLLWFQECTWEISHFNIFDMTTTISRQKSLVIVLPKAITFCLVFNATNSQAKQTKHDFYGSYSRQYSDSVSEDMELLAGKRKTNISYQFSEILQYFHTVICRICVVLSISTSQMIFFKILL